MGLQEREIWEYDQRIVPETWEFVALAVLLLALLSFSFIYSQKKSIREPVYRFYMKGLIAKLFGSLVFCLIYLYYYGGGDTTSYFESSMAMAKLCYQSPSKYFEVLFNPPSPESHSLFTDKTGYPWSYLYADSKTFMVVKLTSILTVLTGKSYFLTSVLLAYFSYLGIWKLFQLFQGYVPEIENKIAIAVLYFPSPLFWAGGVSKDTFTYTASALFVYCAHQLFVKKDRTWMLAIFLFISAWIIISIKPYIFLVLFPGGLLWIFYDKMAKLRSKFLSIFLFPILILGVSFLSYFVLTQLGDNMSKFSIDNALETAAITNYDLKQDYYGGSSFNIGDFDGSFGGMMSLFFPAMNAGMFRPYIWESRSIVLFIAGLENLFLLIFTLYILYKTKIIGTFRIILKNPLLLFCAIFTILFAFMIGLTTSNFGALVRFKIPILPFFVTTLFIIDYIMKKKKER
ncbi:MAG: hypothetical protein J0L87_09690 [Bacteroidetes bacterium]|nr:hypothetical protein [Bacteroidota bacterium]